jgi:hypothetical protein
MSFVIFDFFSGTGSSTQAFRDAGHTVWRFELDNSFEAEEYVNVFDLTVEYLLEVYGQPDFIWASPPCTAFSVASMGHHWGGGLNAYVPKTEAAIESQKLVAHTRKLLEELNPTYGFLIENPRGMLRKLPVVAGLQRQTVTYCQYGDNRMKPTDLWGVVENWQPRAMCKNGEPCHEAAPRGSKTGTQGLKGAKERSRVPYALGQELLKAINKTRADNA